MQTPSDSGLSTPSVFGLPEFMLEGDYMGMQTPHIVGMNNPTTAFKENKQLRRHETPFDTRYHFRCSMTGNVVHIVTTAHYSAQ